MFKLPKIEIPKVKMPDVMGKAKDLTKKVTSEVSSNTKKVGQGIKNLNPFKK